MAQQRFKTWSFLACCKKSIRSKASTIAFITADTTLFAVIPNSAFTNVFFVQYFDGIDY